MLTRQYLCLNYNIVNKEKRRGWQLSISPSLKGKIKALAQRNRRAMSSEVEIALEKHLANKEGKA